MNIFIFCGPMAFGKGGMEKVAASLANYLSKKHVVTLGYFVREIGDRPAYTLVKTVSLAPWFKKLKDSRLDYSKRIVESSADIFIYFGASSQALQVISLLEGFYIPIMMHEGSNPDRVINDSWSNIRGVSRSQAAWEREALYSQASLIRFTMPEYVESLPLDIQKYAVAFHNAFEIPTKYSNVKENKCIINIGGLKKNKNIIPLLNACRDIFRKFPDWKLHIFSAVNNSTAGKEYVEKIARMVSDKGISSNVFLNSEVDDLEPEYLASGIHVITSLSEGLSNAVAESMTYGVPTIGVSNVPGVDGLVLNNRNGILIDREDIENNLYDALDKLMSSSCLREDFGIKAREDAHIFEPISIYRKWEDALKICIENHWKRNSEVHRHYSRVLIDLYRNSVVGFQKGKECRDIQKDFLIIRENRCDDSFFVDKESDLKRDRWSSV